MKIIEVENRDKKLIEQLVTVWYSAVKATHLFLSDQEIEKIKKYVPQALENVEHLIIAEDNDIPVAFIGINNQLIEMLFVEDNKRGKGIGKMLLNYCIEKYNANEVTVNEQNPSARDFYQHLGFKVYKRSEVDEQGNPYPILYMKLD